MAEYFKKCPECGGDGGDRYYACGDCNGSGLVPAHPAAEEWRPFGEIQDASGLVLVEKRWDARTEIDLMHADDAKKLGNIIRWAHINPPKEG